jgi:O-antigen ligase
MAAMQTFSQPHLHQRNSAVIGALRGLENLIFFLLIFQFSTALIALFLTDFNNPEYQSPLARTLWYPGYLGVLLLTIRALPQVLRIAAFNPILILCVLICGVSVFWSIDPGITMRRAIAVLMTTLFGLVLAARYDWNGMVQRLAAVFAATALLSLLIALFLPEYGIHSEVHIGSWRGAWVEKNYMGGFMAKGVIVMLSAFAMRPDRFWIWLPFCALCFFLVLMSTSKTALLISLIGIGGFIFLRLYRRYTFIRPILVLALLGVIGTIVGMLVFAPDFTFALIGKERTLTGRTDIWAGLIESIKLKPWLGNGYGVYWLDPLGPSYYVRLQLQWGIPSAHNGWIETWLSTGALGVGLFAVLFIMTIVLALDRLRKGGTETYWVILSTIMFLGFSMSESTILQQNDLSWVMFVATSAKLFAFEKPYWRDRVRLPYFLARRTDYTRLPT